MALELGRELFQERQRRAAAETAARLLIAQMQQHQEPASLHTIEQLRIALSETEARCGRMRDALGREETARTAAEQSNATLRAALQRAEASAAGREGSADASAAARSLAEAEGRLTSLEGRLATVSSQAELYRRSAVASKRQIHELHQLLATRETEHLRQREGLVAIGGPEVTALVATAREEHENAERGAAEAMRKQLDGKDAAYAELEEEFRAGLSFEATRFHRLHEQYATLAAKFSATALERDAAAARAQRAGELVTEFTKVSGEQQTALAERDEVRAALEAKVVRGTARPQCRRRSAADLPTHRPGCVASLRDASAQ